VDLDSPEVWRWIWIMMAVVFASGELVTPATFFFLPFAIGALAAAVMAWVGFAVGLTWVVFLAVSVVSFALLWKVGRRLERTDEQQEGVGATRWIGQEATVTKAITQSGMGTVRLEREEWRAESLTGAPIREGSTVMVARLAGTRLVVVPVEEPPEPLPYTQPYPDVTSGGPSNTPPQGAGPWSS
jgi:membrane protein implicated in regulation of membrane protease activity